MIIIIKNIKYKFNNKKMMNQIIIKNYQINKNKQKIKMKKYYTIKIK